MWLLPLVRWTLSSKKYTWYKVIAWAVLFPIQGNENKNAGSFLTQVIELHIHWTRKDTFSYSISIFACDDNLLMLPIGVNGPGSP